MNRKVYDLMDWAEIEAVTYSEEDNPKEILGAHAVPRMGTLIQAYYPGAQEMEIKIGARGKWQAMDMADEDGFFVILTKDKLPVSYKLRRMEEDGSIVEYSDPYGFPQVIDEKDLTKFNSGVDYEAYRHLGAHIMTLYGSKGVHFAVWAPNALRVSVVGTFNGWDGRIHQMQRLGDTGVFEIFVPEVEAGAIYKYEIKLRNGDVFLKSDPYGFGAEKRPANASVVRDIDSFVWEDEDWMKGRAKVQGENEPMFVYEVHLGSFMKPESKTKAEDEADGQPRKDEKKKEFFNYKDIAKKLAAYVKKMGYTHVELMPVMEHPLDESWGYQVIGYYAPTARYGSPSDFQYFVNYMHKEGIGVILDWVPAHFPADDHGLKGFDGTCLYEHQDPRQGVHPHWGTMIYNYGRPEVANYLLANALFWAKEYHADGIRMDAVASMLYLDYGRNDGEWIPNMYGGKENLEAIEFIKHLNSIYKKKFPDALLIAEESTAWPMVTGDMKDGALGFDLKWNMGWMNDFLTYMSYDPLYRTHHYGELCFSMIYAYSEKFMLTLSHDEVVHGKGTLISRMPGSIDEKFANLRAAFGHYITHPGKKLLFMGQDIAEFDEWNEKRAIQWFLLDFDNHRYMQNYVRDMVKLYKSEKALYELDNSDKGFEWINCISANENIIVYLRKTENIDDTLLVVCNFENIPRNNYKIGVPYPCRLKEIFNSDSEEYGGFGFVNSRVRMSKGEECDGRPDSIRIKVPPLAVTVFKVMALPDEEKKEAPIKKKSPAARKSSAKSASKSAAKSGAQKAAAKVKPEDVKKPSAAKSKAVTPMEVGGAKNAASKAKTVRKNNTKNK
ncbi:MAG: 1,4-alpha-glucan branching protein GlgB [Lachnospiraceae bacterium]|nr:1,4-alpha-glucan branching protein GlgB [Lachnospiraceae bacterium]